MKLFWSAEAKRDLADIRDYSVRRWGSQVAQAYVGQIVACAKAAAADPSRLRPYHRQYRHARSGSHYVMVSVDTAHQRVTIVRILHERMDLMRHLADPDEA